MAGSATRPPEAPDSDGDRRRADLRRRRELRRKQLRRRRLTALGGLLGVVVLIVLLVVVLSGGGADEGGSSSAGGKSAAVSKKKAGAQTVATTAEYRRESRAISRVLTYTPFVSRGSPRKREIALTIDDGPGPLTPEFVRTLKQLHASATFFVVGQQLNSFSAGLRDVVRAGFPVGDHTEQHPNMTTLSASKQNKQIYDAALRIRSAGVPFPRLFRPPGGAFDATTLRQLKSHRMLAVLWSVDTFDYTQPGTKAIVSRVLAGAKPGAIVLMHDGGGNRSQTLAALPAIVRGLRSKGYTLVTVPQLLLHDPPSRQQARPVSPGA